MKYVFFPILMVCISLCVSCAEPRTVTHSQVLEGFQASKAGGRVFILLPGDKEGFVSSDQAQKEQTRAEFGKALKEKGWQPIRDFRRSDYVLACNPSLTEDGPLTYTTLATPGGRTVMTDPSYLVRWNMRLVKVGLDWQPEKEVWNGSAACVCIEPGDLAFRDKVGTSLIREQLPSRTPKP